MTLRRSLSVLLTLTSLTAIAFSQDQNNGQQPPRQVRGGGGGGGQRFIDDLVTRLELDAQQKEQFDKIIAEARAQAAEAAPADGQGQGRRGGGGPQMMEKVFEQLTPILRPDQVEKLNQARQDMGRGGNRDPMQRLNQLKSDLNLSPDQAAQFDELAGKMREQFQQQQNSDERRQMMEQMREAQQSGEQQKLDEIRTKMRESMSGMNQMMDSFYEDLNKTLTPEQQKKLADYRAQNRMGQNRMRVDAKQVIEIAMKLDLSAEQRAAVAEVEQQFADQIKQAGENQRAGQQTSQRLITEITQMLTDEQKKQFDTMLQRVSDRNNNTNNGNGQQQRGQGRRNQQGANPQGNNPVQETP